MSHPNIRILQGHDKRLRGGGPWLYSNELHMDAAARAIVPGGLVRLVSQDGKAMALAQFNPHSLIAARVLSRNPDATIDEAFLARRIRRALSLRERLYDRPFYRLVHAEADGLPGVIADRYGDILVIQINTQGMHLVEESLLAAFEEVLKPTAILLRNDAGGRTLEGLPEEIRVARGTLPAEMLVEENGLTFAIDLEGGQKTGWFFDQRENRAFTARLAKGLKVLDVYSYAGAFALNALAHGATSAVLVDRAENALTQARQSAERQGVAERCGFVRQEAFKALDEMAEGKDRFGMVVLDPPPFVRSKRDLAVGLKGYRRLAKAGAQLVAEGGFLCVASCSHNVPEASFADEAFAGIRAAGRGGRVLQRGHAGPDHPVHPALPESEYLKFITYALD